MAIITVIPSQDHPAHPRRLHIFIMTTIHIQRLRNGSTEHIDLNKHGFETTPLSHDKLLGQVRIETQVRMFIVCANCWL